MKTVIQIIILSLILPLSTWSQDCLKVNENMRHAVDFNPEWIKQHKVRKIIEREYLKNDSGEVHLINSIYFDTLGYIALKINGQPYPKTNYGTRHVSSLNYEYETIDSFLYQRKIVIRNYNGTNWLATPDTLRKTTDNIFNLFKGQKRRYKNKVAAEYFYTPEGNIDSISYKQGNKRIKFKYQQNKVVHIQNEFELKMLPPSSSSLKYNNKGLIKEMHDGKKFRTKFIYNNNLALTTKELFQNSALIIEHKYEYYTAHGPLTQFLSLADRDVILTVPIKESSPNLENDGGTVALYVCVDKNGNVIEATFKPEGSTTTNAAILDAAIKNALQWKFESSEIEKQCGTITYKFKVLDKE